MTLLEGWMKGHKTLSIIKEANRTLGASEMGRPTEKRVTPNDRGGTFHLRPHLKPPLK